MAEELWRNSASKLAGMIAGGETTSRAVVEAPFQSRRGKGDARRRVDRRGHLANPANGPQGGRDGGGRRGRRLLTPDGRRTR